MNLEKMSYSISFKTLSMMRTLMYKEKLPMTLHDPKKSFKDTIALVKQIIFTTKINSFLIFSKLMKHHILIKKNNSYNKHHKIEVY